MKGGYGGSRSSPYGGGNVCEEHQSFGMSLGTMQTRLVCSVLKTWLLHSVI